MTTYVHSGLTGVGYEPSSGSGTNVVWRFVVTADGVGGTLFPFGTPQRYGGLGWVSPVDFVPAGFDGVMPADFDFIRIPVVWLDVLVSELDLDQYNADIFGISKLAYGLNPGVILDWYEVVF
jgi:hypothetical protein